MGKGSHAKRHKIGKIVIDRPQIHLVKKQQQNPEKDKYDRAGHHLIHDNRNQDYERNDKQHRDKADGGIPEKLLHVRDVVQGEKCPLAALNPLIPALQSKGCHTDHEKQKQTDNIKKRADAKRC